MKKIGFRELFDTDKWKNAVVVFKAESFNNEFSQESRSYKISSDSKYFNPNMGGNSLFGDCLDGKDLAVRLDIYMHMENGWDVDYCYITDTGKTVFINDYIVQNKSQVETDKISDTYHTFEELYHHRMVLFSIICNQNKDHAWKSRLHKDGTMYDDYFIVGITTSEGDYTYHYHLDNWDNFDVKELPTAPEWDGHKPDDITRLLTLI